MKTKISGYKSLSLLVFMSLFLIQCKKDSPVKDNPIIDETPIKNEIIEAQNKRLAEIVTTSTANYALQGMIFDENQKPLSGVNVTAGGETKVTNNAGEFSFDSISLNAEYAIVKASKSGYKYGIRTIIPVLGAKNYANFILLNKGTQQTIEAAKGGEVTFDAGNLKLNFPAGSIADARGSLYSGKVNIDARFLNPDSDDLDNYMPGNLIGLTDENKLYRIISDGMANVELTDENGRVLQIAIGKSVKVTIPNLFEATTNLPVWHFNETYGLWVQSGVTTTTATHFTFEANHFSTWNVGNFFAPIAVKNVLIVNSYGQPIVNQIIDVYGPNNTYIQTAITDHNGRIYLPEYIPKWELRLETACQSLSRVVNMGPGEIVVSFPISDLPTEKFQFSGTLRDCSGVLANSKFHIVGVTDNKINFYGQTDANGQINLSKELCDVNKNIPHKLQLMVVKSDNTTRHQIIDVTFNKSTISMDYNLCSATLFKTPYLNTSLVYGSVKDGEGNIYPTIQIGNQTWMAENLKASKFNDGTSIPNITAHDNWRKATTPAWSFYENNNDYHQLFGNIYNWNAVSTGKLCPKGWHVPTKQEWSTIAQTLGTNGGGKMKIEKVWYPGNLGATNASGFSALSGGQRIDSGFTGVGHRIHIWSATEQSGGSTYANDIYLTGGSTSVFESSSPKINGAYCRCVKD